jgi:hypothetical protein
MDLDEDVGRPERRHTDEFARRVRIAEHLFRTRQTKLGSCAGALDAADVGAEVARDDEWVVAHLLG